MAWTNPKTWVAAATLTAAEMNTYIRDNLLVTAAAIATTSGRLIATDGANSLVQWDMANKGANLTNSTAAAVGSYEDWGTQTLTITQPTQTTALWIGLQGYAETVAGTADTLCAVRLRWSTDGGSTWTDGKESKCELSSTQVPSHGNLSHTTIRTLTSFTGDLVIKAQLQQEAGGSPGDVQFTQGRLNAFVFPA